MDNLNDKIDNAAAMEVDQAAGTNNLVETPPRGATLSGRQIKNMKGGKAPKPDKKKSKKQLAAEAQALTPSKPGDKRRSKKASEPGAKQRKGADGSRKAPDDDSEMHDDLFDEDAHPSGGETGNQTPEAAEPDAAMGGTEEAAAVELPASSSEEEPDTPVSNAARKAAAKADRRRRLKEKKRLEGMKKQDAGLKSQRKPSGTASSAHDSTRSTPGPSKRPTAQQPQTYKVVTPFAQVMANGSYLLARKCHPEDPDLSCAALTLAWNSLQSEKTGDVRHELHSCASMGKDMALGFQDAQTAMSATGTQVPNGDGHHYICVQNRHATASLYFIHKTSLVPVDTVVEATKAVWPNDNFRLFRQVLGRVTLDAWAVEFDAPPKTLARNLRFPGSGKAGKGGNAEEKEWTSSVVAAGQVCFFCESEHEGMSACGRASLVRSIKGSN